MVESEGLRERKRRRTRTAIACAALELFDRQGFRGTTIAQVAEAADVSPRTVSGYFPHKESLAFPDAERDFEGLSARLAEREPGETATAALRDWIRSWIAATKGREAELATRHRVIAASDELRTYERGLAARVQDRVAEAVALDLGLSAGDLEPRIAAAATLTALELLREDFDHPGASDDAVMEAVDRVLRFVDGGIAALRDA